MESPQSLQDKINLGASDAGNYFRTMADFIGFTKEQADAVRESRYVIEKHIPEIVAQFYTHLLRYPPTRKFFLKPDGTVDQQYVQFRMHHLTNFWRRTASGPFDDDYARYIDYVGRSHTRRGADPNIDIAERYVIGQVGFVQHAISEAITRELHEVDPEWEVRAARAWNLLMMVILEMLSRVYHEDEPTGDLEALPGIQHQDMQELAVQTYEQGLGMLRSGDHEAVLIGPSADIPLGSRKIVKIGKRSIGIFHHRSGWYALINKCLHAGGPVCQGELDGDVLTCPWHGFQYDVISGQMLKDPSAKLEMFPVEIRDDQVYLYAPLT
jgi:nitrite reductase/ring-hydroxylating ferredoxin subunit